ncbi:MAG: hypothetical protein ACWA5X_10505 [bacterium]
MQIGTTNTCGMYNHQPPAMGYTQAPYSQQDRTQAAAGGMEISAIGSLLSSMQSSDSATNNEFREFGNTLKTALDTGSFDANSLAESAPDAIKSAAEELGIDLASGLETMLSNRPSRPSEGRPAMPPMGGIGPQGPMGGRPPASAEMDSFMDTLVSAVEAGGTDAAALASDAPEELQTIASQLGIDITQLVEDMATGIEKHGDPRENSHRPPPPLNQQGLTNYTAETSNSTNITLTDVLGGLLTS